MTNLTTISDRRPNISHYFSPLLLFFFIILHGNAHVQIPFVSLRLYWCDRKPCTLAGFVCIDGAYDLPHDQLSPAGLPFPEDRGYFPSSCPLHLLPARIEGG